MQEKNIDFVAPLCVACIVTGLPASGKTTFLKELQKELHKNNVRAFFFHIDNYLDREMVRMKCDVQRKEQETCSKECTNSPSIATKSSEQTHEEKMTFSAEAWHKASHNMHNDVFSLLHELVEKTKIQTSININVEFNEDQQLVSNETKVSLCSRTGIQCVPFIFIEDNMHLISMREKYWRMCRHATEQRTSLSNADVFSDSDVLRHEEYTHDMNNTVQDEMCRKIDDEEFVSLPWIAMVELRFDTPLHECLRQNEYRQSRTEPTTSKQQTINLEYETAESIGIHNSEITVATFNHFEEPNNYTNDVKNVSCQSYSNLECSQQQRYVPPTVIKRLASLFEHGYEKVGLQEDINSNNSSSGNVVENEEIKETHLDNVNKCGKPRCVWQVQISNRQWILITLNDCGTVFRGADEEQQKVHVECLQFIELTNSVNWTHAIASQYVKIIKARLQTIRQRREQRQKTEERRASHALNMQSIQDNSKTISNSFFKQEKSELLLHNVDLRLREVVNIFCKALKDDSANQKQNFTKTASVKKKEYYACAKQECIKSQSDDALQRALDDLVEQFSAELEQIYLQVR